MASITLCEDVLEFMRSQLVLIVIGPAVAAMLDLVKAVEVDAEERVREDARRGGLGKTDEQGSD